MTEHIALKCHPEDNVAVIFAENVKAGDLTRVIGKDGSSELISLRSDIPYGHKLAVHGIRPGEHILKYGESIGTATQEIQPGDYVHVHNLESQRARGDLR